MRPIILVHYDEIALKRGARPHFEKHLIRSLREAGATSHGLAIHRLFGRILAVPADPADSGALAQRFALLPGVASVMEGWETGEAFEDIVSAVDACLPVHEVRSFGVRARRGDKSHPMTSTEIGAAVGAHVVVRRGWKVDLTNPELWIRIELVNRRALVGTRRHEGPGGLPVGGSGRGVVLLSGGIDSPVAAWMMMTRGLELDLVHFHSAPFTSSASQEKVRDLARVLSRYQSELRLVMVPFADPIQRAVVEKTPERYRVILYRRFMMRLAERAARERRARCLVTGESLGQVASQTLDNLATVEAAAGLTVLRPLVGLGKNRIVEIAKRIGTYPVSIRPHEDCCTYLMPAKPATRSSPDEIDAIETALDVGELVGRTWDSRVEERIPPPPASA